MLATRRFLLCLRAVPSVAPVPWRTPLTEPRPSAPILACLCVDALCIARALTHTCLPLGLALDEARRVIVSATTCWGAGSREAEGF